MSWMEGTESGSRLSCKHCGSKLGHFSTGYDTVECACGVRVEGPLVNSVKANLLTKSMGKKYGEGADFFTSLQWWGSGSSQTDDFWPTASCSGTFLSDPDPTLYYLFIGEKTIYSMKIDKYFGKIQIVSLFKSIVNLILDIFRIFLSLIRIRSFLPLPFLD